MDMMCMDAEINPIAQRVDIHYIIGRSSANVRKCLLMVDLHFVVVNISMSFV